MKRMEELIHLNKKIHFEGKVSDIFLHLAVGSGVVFLKHCFFFADIPSDLSVQMAGEARWAPGSGHADDEHLWLQAQVPHQTRVPPPVQRLSPAVQEEGVSEANVTVPPGSKVKNSKDGSLEGCKHGTCTMLELSWSILMFQWFFPPHVFILWINLVILVMWDLNFAFRVWIIALQLFYYKVWLNYDLILYTGDAAADSDTDENETMSFLIYIHSTWKFMVFVHAKIGELKVKDLSQKLKGISGFIFHLQLCEGQQLKHQILLKSTTEWGILRLQSRRVSAETDQALTARFVSFCLLPRSGKQRWITAMFPSDPLEDIDKASENVGQWTISSSSFFSFFLLSHCKHLNAVIHHLTSCMFRYFPGAVHQEL